MESWLLLTDAMPFFGGGGALPPTLASDSCRDRRLAVVEGAPRREALAPAPVPVPPAALEGVDLESARGDRTFTLGVPGARLRTADRGVSGVEEDDVVEEDVVEATVGSSVGPPAVPLLHEMLLRFDFFLRAAVIFRMGSFTSGLSIMTIPFNALPSFQLFHRLIDAFNSFLSQSSSQFGGVGVRRRSRRNVVPYSPSPTPLK